MSYQKKLFLLIIVGTALRLLFTTTTELSADEVYYWTYALKLQWNYFDHPPIVAWLIRLTTGNLLFNNEFFVRVGAVVACAICTWLVFKIGSLLQNQQTGWFAALLYTASVYGSITIGANIIPDSAEMVFWLSSVLLLIKISRLTTTMQKANLLWCLFGLMVGLCIMSKVHGAFLWFGAVLYVLVINRNWLKYRGIYLAAVITLVIISPIIIWNVQNNFISYKFHSGRISVIGAGVHISSFFKAIAGQVTSSNPFNFFLIWSNLLLVFKQKLPIDKKEIKLLLFCSLPLIAVILIISLSRETFAHWAGPAYSCLLFLPAAKLASVPKTNTTPGVIKWALAYVVMVALLQIFIINYYPGTLSVQKQGPKTGNEDLTLDMYGWRAAQRKIDSVYKSDVAKKIMPPGAPIIATDWATAATIQFYIAGKTGQEVLGIGNVDELHQYYFTNKYKQQLKKDGSAYYIVPSNGFYYRALNQVTQNFKSYDTPLVIVQYRSGLVCRYLSVYRMRGYTKHATAGKL